MPDLDTPIVVEQILPPDLPAPAQDALTAGPYNFRFTGDDFLRLTVHNAVAGIVVAIAYRMQRRDGAIVANTEIFAPTSDRSAGGRTFPIGEGYLLNATAFVSSGAAVRGQTFTRLRVVRGGGAAFTPLGVLVQGYVTSNQDRAWPGSIIEGSTDGDGYHRLISGTTPAAGVEIAESVPTGARWELVTFHTQFTTSAAAGLRRPTLRFDDGANRYFQTAAPDEWGVSTVQDLDYAATAWLTATIDPDAPLGGLPPGVRLLAGHRILTNTRNFQAGDRFNEVRYSVREWLEAQ